MIQKNLVFVFIVLFSISIHAQVGIGTITPDPSAALDITSTETGILIPRLTQAERDLIVSPATGLLIFQTDGTAGFYYWNGTVWSPFSGGAASNWAASANDIYNANSGNVGVGTATPTTKLHIESIGSAMTIVNQDFESAITPFTTGGDANWALQTTTVNSGSSAAGSGAISDNQTTYMEYAANIPAGGATLSFYSSVSSEVNFDFLRFYINGLQQDEWSGNLSYAQQTYALAQGTNTLRWAYEKDVSASSGSDAAFIDDVVISSAAPPALRLVDGNQATGKALISDANGNATWQQLTNADIADIPLIVSFSGMEIPMCDVVSVGSTGTFSVTIKGVPTTVNWQVLARQTTAGTVISGGGIDVLAAPLRPERLQVRYDFSPPLPFTPLGFIFSANNNSSFPDTFSLNYAAKSATSLTMNITRTDVFGDQSANCWAGQFYFDVFMTD
ncbi:hypothetical protein [Ulvibacter antarcticus]|nr:hypothetical protein [Ulvibacter antarcticus]